MTTPTPRDPLLVLRQYRRLAPWNLRDLAAVAGALLETSGVRPTSAVARAQPRARTIRYYVAQGLVAPPQGKGGSATYAYRHLLQVLMIKLRQMDGASLETIRTELHDQAGDSVERQVAAALGRELPPPQQLVVPQPATARGRAGRALHTWHALAPDEPVDVPETSLRFAATKWHRIPVVRGLELHVHEGHPAAQQIAQSAEIADAVRAAVNRVVLHEEPT